MIFNELLQFFAFDDPGAMVEEREVEYFRSFCIDDERINRIGMGVCSIQGAKRLPALVPMMMSIGICSSSRTLRTPRWAMPLIAPPPSARATLGGLSNFLAAGISAGVFTTMNFGAQESKNEIVTIRSMAVAG